MNDEPDGNYLIKDVFPDMGRTHTSLFSITIRPDIPLVDIYLHSRKEVNFENEANGMEIKYEKGFENLIKYQRTVLLSLTHPFATNCVDYTQRGYDSRDECFTNCKIKELKNRIPGWPATYRTDNFTDEFFNFNYSRKKFLNSYASDVCNTFCGLSIDCKTYIFDIKLDRYKIYKEHFGLVILPPIKPDKVIKESPKIIFEEFVSFVGSLIGFYFGFSVIMLTDVYTLLSKHFVNYFKININSNNTKIVNISVKPIQFVTKATSKIKIHNIR